MTSLLPSTKDLSMSSLIEQALPQRNPGYLEAWTEKLVGEGIISPGDLLLTSKVALETKLSTHPSFNFMEMADTVNCGCAHRSLNLSSELLDSRSVAHWCLCRSVAHC